MHRLHVAMPEKGAADAFKKWDEITAGAWRKYVNVDYLSDDKDVNDGIVSNLAKAPNSWVYTSQHLTSKSVSEVRHNIRRLKKHVLLEEVEKWLDMNDLVWRTRTKKNCDLTPFTCISADEWVAQFARMDPVRGQRAGAALLAQFHVINDSLFEKYFSSLPRVDHNTYFLGADPHSGDLGLVSILAGIIDNNLLEESRKLPQLKKNAEIRLFCDGSWSGGETERRIRCMVTKCPKKTREVEKTQRLSVHLGFMTDAAENRIKSKMAELVESGIVQNGHINITSPNRLVVKGMNSGQKGLAFHDTVLLEYVDKDPKALKILCRILGEQLNPEKPLGTNEIASCIAFAHSLPSAMLPLFTVEKNMVDAAGVQFTWRPLLKSEHMSTGQKDMVGYHCEECPLADRTTKPIMASANEPAVQTRRRRVCDAILWLIERTPFARHQIKSEPK